MRLETLGALSAFSAALLAVEQAGTASSTGLSLSYALQITQLTNMTVRLASLAENAFNAVGEQAEACLRQLPAKQLHRQAVSAGVEATGRALPTLCICNRSIESRLRLSSRRARILSQEFGKDKSVRTHHLLIMDAGALTCLHSCAERISEYSEIPEEPPAVVPDSVPPSWPSKGQARRRSQTRRHAHRLVPLHAPAHAVLSAHERPGCDRQGGPATCLSVGVCASLRCSERLAVTSPTNTHLRLVWHDTHESRDIDACLHHRAGHARLF